MFRQGDILIEVIKSIPPQARLQPNSGRIVLAEGEATGHRHEIISPTALSFLDEDGLYLNLMEKSTLQHAEHGSIELPAGTYRMIRQREFSTGDRVKDVYD